ncbi:MAG TPA: carbamoyltransferase N-terminal domain-containing protein [Verrucomicrobiota bacterium]|nr:carbamoyltransferase N-terminal domain-containing protein [Verrucomicrobiota bacterium]
MAKPTYILGVSCYYHDSAAALLKDGELVFAAHEERYTRVKQDESFPANAVKRALAHAGITPSDLAAVAYYEKPLLKFFDRIVPTAFKVWPRGLRMYHHAMQEWMSKKLWIPQNIQKELEGFAGEILYVPHHESHAASAFYPSGFEEAAVGDDHDRPRQGRRPAPPPGDPLPPQPGAALLRDHLLPRLPREQRGVQGDGPGALR